jgi:DNA-binding NarL/FixJ family response regulator
MVKIRILLIEDNRLLREGIAAVLNGQSDLEVVARVEDGNAATRKSPSVFTSPPIP